MSLRPALLAYAIFEPVHIFFNAKLHFVGAIEQQ